MSVYENDADKTHLGDLDKTAKFTDLKTQVKFSLVKGKTYNFVFWAQAEGATCYDIDDLKNIKISYEGAVANDETRDAFYATRKELKVNGALTETIKLYRPFAQVNFGTADLLEAAAAGFIPVKSAFTATDVANVFDTFNAEGKVEGTATDKVTFAAAKIPVEPLVIKDGTKYAWMTMNYIIPVGKQGEKHISNVTAEFITEAGDAITASSPQTPVQNNYRTNILGNLLTSQVIFNVEIVPIFNEPDNDIDLVNIKNEASLRALFATGGEATLTEDVVLGETVSVEAGKEVVLDLNGKTISNTEDLWDVPDANANNWSLLSVKGGTLTIKGAGTLQAKENDCYAVDVQDGGTVVIEDGTYVGNIDAVYVHDGAAEIKGGKYSIQQTYPNADKAYEFVLNCLDQNRENGTAKILVSGGEFVNFNPADCAAEGAHTSFLAPGYVSVKNGNVWTVLPEVKDAAALESVFNEGGVVALANDLVLDRTLSVPAGKEVVLDLNGKTISNTADLWDEEKDAWSLLSVRGGSLTIKGAGTLQAKENDCFVVDVQDGGKVVIEDGTYVGNIDAVYVYEGSAEIKGGKFSIQQTAELPSPYGYVLNCYDTNRKNGTAKILVSGGEFVKFNPADCAAEGPHTNFVADGYMSVEAEEGVWTVVRGTKPVVMTLAELRATLKAFTSAGSGDNVIEIGKDIVLKEGETWTPVHVDGYNGAGVVTVLGNGHKISGLNAPLFAGGFAGHSGIIVKDLTLDGVKINDTASSLAIGAFVGAVDSMPTIELDNCHLTNSEIISTAGARVGGLIGWTAGYDDPNNGPVKTYIKISKCSVEECKLEAKGSVGGIIGHAGCNTATFHTITDCAVKNCVINSTDDGGWRVGVVVGTANVGEVTITNITESGNTITQTGKTAPEHSRLYGRFVPQGGHGKLVIDGVAVAQ